jgi:hypothetical protein
MKFYIRFVAFSFLLAVGCTVLAQTAAIPPATSSGPTNFSGKTSNQIVGVTQKGGGTGWQATSIKFAAVAGTITGPSNTAVYGHASNTTSGSNAAGVTGQADSDTGPGVQGVTTSPNGMGVQGVNLATTGGNAVVGLANATTGAASGVYGAQGQAGLEYLGSTPPTVLEVSTIPREAGYLSPDQLF